MPGCEYVQPPNGYSRIEIEKDEFRLCCETPTLHGCPLKKAAKRMIEKNGNRNENGESTDEPVSGSDDTVRLAEERFYSLYDWCLNPAQSLKELLQRFRDELGRSRTAEFGWQRDECRINLYLFVCAIACTVDDYLASRLAARLDPVSKYFPRWKPLVTIGQWFLDRIQELRRHFTDQAIRRWRERWRRCVDQACESLLRTATSGESLSDELERTSQELMRVPLPERLLSKRMRLPEAFRCQDFTHQDVISLVRLFVDSSPNHRQPYLVIGLRTAGSYFAPLMAAYLRLLDWPLVSWITIRPKNGISAWEGTRLRRLLRQDTRVLVVDDYPNTGLTFGLTLRMLRRFKVPAERVTVLAPRHAARPDWSLPADIRGSERISIFSLGPAQLLKAGLLEPKSMEILFQEYYRAQGWQRACVINKKDVEEINAGLWRHYSDGFHVRLKRVFAVRLSGPGGKSEIKKVFVKSSGWGWLGYHSYISGTRLSEFVPPVIGLRNGLLLTEWIEGQVPRSESEAHEIVLNTIPSYLAARVRRLPLSGDVWLEGSSYRGTGWDELIGVLRGAYGRYTWPLKMPALRSQLRKYLTHTPTLGDGKMGPEEWILTDSKPRKGDFEHHNFGGGELDIVDPAYDLASAVFEFGLSAGWEQKLLHAYARESGDTTIFERILLYKLLYGSIVMRRATSTLSTGSLDGKAKAENLRYLQARNFLAFQMNQFSAGLMGRPERPTWSKFLFFLDLDGVFDRELLGFPHTSWKGLQSLALLQSHGYSVVLNTGRSVQHVRDYCQSYTLPGGLAEYGSVFVDAVRQTETPLVGAEAAGQLKLCREAIHKLPGVFTDPGYEYSIRAYRYPGRNTAGLSVSEVTNLLSSPKFDKLTFISRGPDTYIVQKETGKGPGLLAAKELLESPKAPTAGIGNSEEDTGMLQAVDLAYAPANCSADLRQLAAEGRCRVMGRPFQWGLLEAVLDLLPSGHKTCNGNGADPARALNHPNDLIRTLLHVADRQLPSQILSALNWRSI